MSRPPSLVGLKDSEVLVFIKDLDGDKRRNLFIGDYRNFDVPLKEILVGLKEEEKMPFVREFLRYLSIDEKKLLLECDAFDCLSENGFEEFRALAVL